MVIALAVLKLLSRREFVYKQKRQYKILNSWNGKFRDTQQTLKRSFIKVVLICMTVPANTPRVFHFKKTWKRSFPRRFNV